MKAHWFVAAVPEISIQQQSAHKVDEKTVRWYAIYSTVEWGGGGVTAIMMVSLTPYLRSMVHSIGPMLPQTGISRIDIFAQLVPYG
jgi:hypothetical protein